MSKHIIWKRRPCKKDWFGRVQVVIWSESHLCYIVKLLGVPSETGNDHATPPKYLQPHLTVNGVGERSDHDLFFDIATLAHWHFKYLEIKSNKKNVIHCTISSFSVCATLTRIWIRMNYT